MRKILLVDDHPMILEGYHNILKQVHRMGQYFLATDIDSAMAISQANAQIDLILVDYQIGTSSVFDQIKNGLDLSRAIKLKHPTAHVLLITAHEQATLIYQILHSNTCQGVLIKSDVTSEVLLQAITQVQLGNTYRSIKVMTALRAINTKELLLKGHNIQILMLLEQGYQMQELPSLVHKSLSTIARNVALLREVFDVKDNGHLILEASLQGYL